jgi:hypothetical protein
MAVSLVGRLVFHQAGLTAELMVVDWVEMTVVLKAATMVAWAQTMGMQKEKAQCQRPFSICDWNNQGKTTSRMLQK